MTRADPSDHLLSDGSYLRVGPKALRNALGCFATGVTIVTTRTEDDELLGVTANSFNSVSLEPPLVLVSLGRSLRSIAKFEASPWFAVSVLGAHQRELSRLFAEKGGNKWQSVSYSSGPICPAPLIGDAHATFECEQWTRYSAGDHVIFVGRVLDLRIKLGTFPPSVLSRSLLSCCGRLVAAMHTTVLSAEAIEGAIGRRGRLQPFVSLTPSRTGLLVVDMQTAFLAPGSPAELPMAREIVPNINRLARALRQAGGIVVWIVSTYGNEAESEWPVVFKYVMNGGKSKAIRDALADSTPGHGIWPSLERKPEDPIISKNRFSPFVDPALRMETLLHTKGIDTVLVVGTVTNVCCESTARDAAMRNFKTIMVADANAARNDAEHNATLSTFIQVFGGVLETSELERMISTGLELT